MANAISPNPERDRPAPPAARGGMRSGRTALPAPIPSLVGREQEIDHVLAMLRRRGVRLITLTGPGGVGKTRLALAVGAAAAPTYPGGVVFLPLASVRDPRLVAAEIAHAFGIMDPSNASFADQMAAAAGDAGALLVVDNVEHLLPAAPVLTQLLEACPNLTLLITSRERLRLSGEYDIPVLPLACPDHEGPVTPDLLASAPAVRLFVERTQEISPWFVVTEANGAAIAAICHRLDGLPLALELAAARGTHLPPAALLARMARRLPLLTGGPRDAPARLRTMRDAITWSHELLLPNEKALFRRIAVFAPGFTLEAIEAVWTDRRPGQDDPSSPAPDPSTVLLDLVASLVDKSLLRPATTGVGAEPRFELLETIREFGLECLAEAGETGEVRTAHAAYYLSLVERVTSDHRDNGAGLDRLEDEHANIRAALVWCGSGGSARIAIRLAARLGQFWLRRGYQVEGRGWLERSLAAAPEEHPPVRTAALNALGDLLRDLGEHVGSRRSFEHARALAHDSSDGVGEATALTGLAALSDDVGDDDATRAFSDASADLWRHLGDRAGLARALHNRGWAEAGLGNVAAATALFHDALGHASAAGSDRSISHILNSLGNLLVEQGDYVSARPLLDESLVAARAADDRADTAEILADLGWLALEMGDHAAARTHLGECLALLNGIGRGRAVVFALEACAILAAADGEHDRAVRIVGAVSAMRENMGVPLERDSRVHITGPSTARRALHRLARAVPAIRPRCSAEDAFRDAVIVAPWRPVASPPADRAAQPASPGSWGGGTLSPREAEVVRMIVEGHSDRGIAEALFISRRTASKHVASILAKLDVGTRAEAAVRAVRDGIV